LAVDGRRWGLRDFRDSGIRFYFWVAWPARRPCTENAASLRDAAQNIEAKKPIPKPLLNLEIPVSYRIFLKKVRNYFLSDYGNWEVYKSLERLGLRDQGFT
jgi:hypothetical protein